MTYAEFLQALEQTPRDWRVSSGCIRRGPLDARCECPLTAPVHKTSFMWIGAGRQLGLSSEEAKAIADAADDPEFCDHAVRADLLRACGLPDEVNS